ncbi:MAG: hypothetical protein WCP06_12865, partial [Verrucomicrobiota bacterium]
TDGFLEMGMKSNIQGWYGAAPLALKDAFQKGQFSCRTLLPNRYFFSSLQARIAFFVEVHVYLAHRRRPTWLHSTKP